MGAVRDRIRTARRRDDADEPGHDVHLIVVTKYFPASDVAALVELGVTDIGENKDQEAAPKAAETSGPDPLDPAEGLRWHFIGQLQSNKAKSVVRYAHAVHAVDRPSLIKALSKAMTTEQQRRADDGQGPRPALRCFIQVNLDAERASGDTGSPATGSRGGADPHDVEDLADRVAAADELELAGVMAVAPLDGDPAEAFARLRQVSASLRARHPRATAISAGMSHDLEEAVQHGATHLRVGSDVLGARPAVR